VMMRGRARGNGLWMEYCCDCKVQMKCVASGVAFIPQPIHRAPVRPATTLSHMQCSGGGGAATLFSTVFPAAGYEATEVLADTGTTTR